MTSSSIQWLVKNIKGTITGPFSTSEVIRKIRSGVYVGEEQISLYPEGEWKSISYEESFFDELLNVLQDDGDPKAAGTRHSLDLQEDQEDPPTPTPAPPQRDWGNPVVPEKITDEKTTVKATIERQKQSVSRLPESAKKGRAVEDDKPTDRPRIDDSLAKAKKDLKKKKALKEKREQYRALREKKKNQRKFRNLLIVGLLGVIGFFLFTSEEPQQIEKGERVRLLAPVYSKKNTMQNSEGLLKRALKFFREDSLENYQKAQQALVTRVESKKDLTGYMFLCMTYKELWEDSFQDEKDFQTILFVQKIVQKIDRYSDAASVCQVVNQWVNGNYKSALRIMEAKLRTAPEFVFFNQMAGDIYATRKDYTVAAYYFSKAREFWRPKPVWARTMIQEARMMRRLKKYGEAITLYRHLLDNYPRHAVGQIEKGILEFQVYQHIDKAKNHIVSGLQEGGRIPRLVESEAYLNLAKMNLLQGDRKRAVKNSKRAFSVDSTNREARKLVISLGGIKALNSITIDNASMVYVGEQYMKMENYTSAQATFRAAYEADPTNTFAALRAGQALWKLNQGREAIAWVQKAALADPTFVRSYVILADYLSARYDFKNALASLNQARRINKRHHEVWRGFALVEFRRRNFKAAVRFGERALKLYDTDVEALLILAQAQKELGDVDQSYKYIQQASELDSSNETVQANYARILVELQGPYAGEVFLKSLITQMPKKLIFRRTLGEILLEEERLEDAIDVFQEILAIQSKDKLTLMKMALVLKKKGEKENFDLAREYLMEAASLDPSDAEPLFQLGQLYLDSNQARFAQAQFQRVIQVNPMYPLAHYNSGLAHLKMGNLDQALEMAKAEKAMNPGLPEPYLLAGETYFKMSFSKDQSVASSSATLCADEYRASITKGYVAAEAYIWLARCLRISGALDPAESMLNEAEKLESGNPGIYKEYGAIYEVQGKLEKAIFWYNKYLRLSPEAKDNQAIKKRIKILDSNIEEAL